MRRPTFFALSVIIFYWTRTKKQEKREWKHGMSWRNLNEYALKGALCSFDDTSR